MKNAKNKAKDKVKDKVRKLSTKQQKVFDQLKRGIDKNGYPPTIRELCDACDLKSTATIHSHLATLERKGYIRRSPSKNRSIEILEKGFYDLAKVANVPIISPALPEGMPLKEFPEQTTETFAMPKNNVPGKAFMVRAEHDIPEHSILTGDLLLFRRQDNGPAGALAAVLEEDEGRAEVRVRVLDGDCGVLGVGVGLYRGF